jgi:two-component system, response regulator PdtaR
MGPDARNEVGHRRVNYRRRKERRLRRISDLSLLENRNTSRGLEVQIVSYAASKQVVLIVEDEALVRMIAVDMIEQAGFEILEAANADEAILLLEGRRDITVLFTDIEMPGSMDGLRLAQAVRGRWPPIKIIATSGRCVVRDGDLPSGGVFLPKPYSSTQICNALRDLTAEA